MAKSLRRAGYSVQVFDVRREVAERLLRKAEWPVTARLS